MTDRIGAYGIGLDIANEHGWVRSVLCEPMVRAAQAHGSVLEFFEVGPFDYRNPASLISDFECVICDLSNASHQNSLELGIAIGKAKPLILIARPTTELPPVIAGVEVLIYDEFLAVPFFTRLKVVVQRLIEEPQSLVPNLTNGEGNKRKVFISYSHSDTQILNRLLVHLKPLQKEGVIDYWVDTKLRAGDNWRKEIESALRAAKVAILLVSADFLASDFIVDNELPPLLAKAKADGTRIIPIVISQCRFVRDPHLSQFQAINDPSRPLLTLDHAEMESVLDSVAADLEAHFES